MGSESLWSSQQWGLFSGNSSSTFPHSVTKLTIPFSAVCQFLTRKVVKDMAVRKAIAATSTISMKQITTNNIIKKAYGMDWQNTCIPEEKTKKIMAKNCDSSHEQCWKQRSKTFYEEAITQ